MTTPHPVPTTTSTGDSARLPRRARVVLLVLFVIAAAGMAAFASSAFSQGFGHGFGPPWHARWGQSFDPAAIEDRADRMVRHLSIEVDATPDQQERLRGIVRSAVRDLLPLREKAVTSRQRGRELLTQTTIDRAAIETLRAEQMGLADQATRRVSQALADAATVLSPEQRRKIAERIDRWRSFGHGWHRG
jgi:Spy/CpxP family protein refolding chaperone